MIKAQLFEKEYCMVCGHENPQDREICECGGRDSTQKYYSYLRIFHKPTGSYKYNYL